MQHLVDMDVAAFLLAMARFAPLLMVRAQGEVVRILVIMFCMGNNAITL